MGRYGSFWFIMARYGSALPLQEEHVIARTHVSHKHFDRTCVPLPPT